jgi:hypothetical protein
MPEMKEMYLAGNKGFFVYGFFRQKEKARQYVAFG